MAVFNNLTTTPAIYFTVPVATCQYCYFSHVYVTFSTDRYSVGIEGSLTTYSEAPFHTHVTDKATFLRMKAQIFVNINRMF